MVYEMFKTIRRTTSEEDGSDSVAASPASGKKRKTPCAPVTPRKKQAANKKSKNATPTVFKEEPEEDDDDKPKGAHGGSEVKTPTENLLTEDFHDGEMPVLCSILARTLWLTLKILMDTRYFFNRNGTGPKQIGRAGDALVVGWFRILLGG